MAVKLEVPTKRFSFNVMRELYSLQNIMPKLPEADTTYKIVTLCKFTSLAFIKYMADNIGIEELLVSTLVIGKQHMASLDIMHRQKKIKKATFIVGSLMKDGASGKKEYHDLLIKMCQRNQWECFVTRNHSKVHLYDTKIGKFVLETSSNLNNNLSVEQYSFLQSEELYEFYKEVFLGIKKERV